MASVFSLPREPTAGPDVTSWYYQRIEASSALNENQLAGATVRFRIEPQGRHWFLPNRSYFRIRYELDEDGAGTAQTAVTPTMGFGGNLVKTMDVRVGGQTVSQVNVNMAQIDAIHNRSKRAGIWLSSTGDEANRWSSNYPASRIALDTLRKAQEVVWQPPLGFFQVSHALPGMMYDIGMTINPNYERDCVTAVNNAIVVPNVDYKIRIKEISFQACFAAGPRGDDEKFVLNIDEWSAQIQPISASGTDTLKQFDVSPTTNVLAIALQDTRISDNRVSASRFRILGTVPNTNDPNDAALALRQYYLEYGGQQFPRRFADPVYSAAAFQTAQEVIGTQLQTGTYFLSGGGENTSDFYARGAFYFHQVARDATSQSTRVHVHTTFDQNYNNVGVILFARAPKAYLIRSSDSRVVQVEGAMTGSRGN